jgi:hypothetical protein
MHFELVDSVQLSLRPPRRILRRKSGSSYGTLQKEEASIFTFEKSA